MAFVNILYLVLITFSAPAYSWVDLKVSGGIVPSLDNNRGQLPEPVSGSTAKGSYSVDLVLSEFIFIVGARYSEGSIRYKSTYYLDHANNQYTKYDLKSHAREVSGIVGSRIVQDDFVIPKSGGSPFAYSLSLIGAIPFWQYNEIYGRHENSARTEIFSAKPREIDEFSVYVEGTGERNIFIWGVQLGYHFKKMHDFRTSSDATLLNYRGNPQEVNLSGTEIRIFVGVRL